MRRAFSHRAFSARAFGWAGGVARRPALPGTVLGAAIAFQGRAFSPRAFSPRPFARRVFGGMTFVSVSSAPVFEIEFTTRSGPTLRVLRLDR